MNQKHYKNMLSEYLDHELRPVEHQEIAEHLLQCSDCRGEHDLLKRAAALARGVGGQDAPPHVWQSISDAINDSRSPQIQMIPDRKFFGLRNWVGYAAALVLVTLLVSAVYFSLFTAGEETVKRPVIKSNESQEGHPLSPGPVKAPVNPAANVEQAESNTHTEAPPNITPPSAPRQDTASNQAWQFEALSGTPKVGLASGGNSLAVGDYLETDAASRARISVADIGNVEIEPNSRVKLVGTNSTEHRLSLERGILQAQISAPPRLFIVDTPSAVAVDLGCEYRLEVDRSGNSRLNVTKGFVSLELAGRESIVPAGAVCITKRGRGLGTPFAADTTDVFRTALERFDFGGGGGRSVAEMLEHRSFYDMVTLWHLLSRVNKTDREKVYDALSEYVKPPTGVTREGILRVDKKMLGLWRSEVERVWFE